MTTKNQWPRTARAASYASPSLVRIGDATVLTLDGGCGGCDNFKRYGATHLQ